MGGQGCDHHSRLDLWHSDLVALLLYALDQFDLDLGIKQETVAHTGWIQHHVGVVKLHGISTAFG